MAIDTGKLRCGRDPHPWLSQQAPRKAAEYARPGQSCERFCGRSRVVNAAFGADIGSHRNGTSIRRHP